MKRKNIRDNYTQFQDATASGQVNLFLYKSYMCFFKNRAISAASVFAHQQRIERKTERK